MSEQKNQKIRIRQSAPPQPQVKEAPLKRREQDRMKTAEPILSDSSVSFDLTRVSAINGLNTTRPPLVHASHPVQAASDKFPEALSGSLLVEDAMSPLKPGQMRRGEFLQRLREEITRAVDQALTGTGRNTEGCPYIRYWFDVYSRRDSYQIERALYRYAPEARHAGSAVEYIAIAAQRAGTAAEKWAVSGKITGLPSGISTSLSGEPPMEPGSPADRQNMAGTLHELQHQLGEGQPLDSRIRSRMESAFGIDFAHVRAHTGMEAASLSRRRNARAFTIGNHIAFNDGEYKPGTLVGDALLAHELAHTIQQRGANADSMSTYAEHNTSGEHALEADADRSAAGAIKSLWRRKETGLQPRLSSGLSIQRCSTSPSSTLRIEHVSGATEIDGGSSAPDNTLILAAKKETAGNVTVQAAWSEAQASPPEVTWNDGEEVTGNAMRRQVSKTAWDKFSLSATGGEHSADAIIYIVGAEQTDYSPADGQSGNHFADNNEGYASTGLIGPDPASGEAESRCEIEFTVKPDQLTTDANAGIFNTDHIQWDVSREKKVKKWTKAAGSWSLVDDRGSSWASDDTSDAEEDNDPWDGSGHIYGNDKPKNIPGGVQAYVKKLNMREWVRVGLGGATGRSGDRCTPYFAWHAFRSLKKNGSWANDNTYGNEIPTGNDFWGTVPTV